MLKVHMYYFYRPSLRRQKNARICRALKNSGLENNLQKAQQITSNIGSWLVNALVSYRNATGRHAVVI